MSDFRQVLVDVIRYNVENRLPQEYLTESSNIQVSVLLDEWSRQLVVRLEAFLGSSSQETTDWHEIQTPATWWDHLKLRVGWGRVNYRTHRLPHVTKVTNVCPHLPVGHDDRSGYRNHLIFLLGEDPR